MRYSEVVDALVVAVPEIGPRVVALRSEFAPDPVGAYNVLDFVWSEFIVSRLHAPPDLDALSTTWAFVETLADSDDPECRALASELVLQLRSEGVLEIARPLLGPRAGALLVSLERDLYAPPTPWWRRLLGRSP